MTQRVNVAVEARPAGKKLTSQLLPNRESEGLKLAFSALKSGETVSTDGMSKEEYISWARARAQNSK